jgi:hypothetical protein
MYPKEPVIAFEYVGPPAVATRWGEVRVDDTSS